MTPRPCFPEATPKRSSRIANQPAPTDKLTAPQAEYRAITSVFPQKSLRINGTKSMIGHLLGGASGVEAVATIKALHTGQQRYAVYARP